MELFQKKGEASLKKLGTLTTLLKETAIVFATRDIYYQQGTEDLDKYFKNLKERIKERFPNASPDFIDNYLDLKKQIILRTAETVAHFLNPGRHYVFSLSPYNNNNFNLVVGKSSNTDYLNLANNVRFKIFPKLDFGEQNKIVRVDYWNPSDFYIHDFNAEGEISNFINNKKKDDKYSLTEVNNFLGKNLDAKTIIGVSLKDSKNPKIQVINSRSQVSLSDVSLTTITPLVRYSQDRDPENITTTFTLKVSLSKDSLVYNISIRSFHSSPYMKVGSDIKVQGSDAISGKILNLFWSSMFKNYGIDDVASPNFKLKLVESKLDYWIPIAEEYFLSFVQNSSTKKFFNTQIEQKDVQDYFEDIQTLVENNNLNYVTKNKLFKIIQISCYIKLLTTIYSESTKKFIKFLEKVINWGERKTDAVCPHIKVS